VFLEVCKWKRKSVVDADKRREFFGEALNQPFSDSSARPVFARTRGRQHFFWSACVVSGIDAQALEARRRRLSAGVVDANVAMECGVHACDQRNSALNL